MEYAKGDVTPTRRGSYTRACTRKEYFSMVIRGTFYCVGRFTTGALLQERAFTSSKRGRVGGGAGFFFPGAVVIRGWKRRFVGAWCGGGGLRVDLWSFPKSNIDVGCGYKDTFCMIHYRGVVESGILLILYLR